MTARAARARAPAGLRRAAAALALCLLAAGGARPAVVEFGAMRRAPADAPPPGGPAASGAAGDARGAAPAEAAAGAVPGRAEGAAWYGAAFERAPDAPPAAQWAVYLPFLYEGGQVWINGALAGTVPEGTPSMRVRWERPHLVPVPPGLLQPGANRIAIRTADQAAQSVRNFPRVAVGPLAELQPRADRRTFWVRTMPQVTAVVCLLVAGFVLFIYWRRRSEELYGLFGLAAALWGVRTLTFVIERMPAGDWHLWRMAYQTATCGFVVVLALFAMRLAGIRQPALERGLLAFWLAAPLCLALAGPEHEAAVNRVWGAGLVPVGVGALALSLRTVWRRRTAASAAMPCAFAVAVPAGVHDYLLAWRPEVLARLAPQDWVAQRIFLLHYGADLMLVAMGALLTARFLDALSSMESANGRLADLNATLESRVAERERHLAENFGRMAELQRAHAASQERQLIMREIHDGLGSRLFTSLLRVERGDMDRPQIADALRDCIADMRLALEVLAPDDDFEAALGNFLFRWQAQMQDAQVAPRWCVELPQDGLRLSRQAALQLLRVAQEALTNVLKHARARHVRIDLRQRDGQLELEVSDDGLGADFSAPRAGRGLANMRARAAQLGGALELRSGAGGTRVLLRLPLSRVAPAAAG